MGFFFFISFLSAVCPFQQTRLHTQPALSRSCKDKTPPGLAANSSGTDSLFDRRPVTLAVGNESPACFCCCGSGYGQSLCVSRTWPCGMTSSIIQPLFIEAFNLHKPWDSSPLVKHSWHTAGHILNHSFCVAGFTAGCCFRMSFCDLPSRIEKAFQSFSSWVLFKRKTAKMQNVGQKQVCFNFFHISV